MAYGKSVEEVATKFDIEVADRTAFVSENLKFWMYSFLWWQKT
jgi:hypothetical protein